MADAVSVHFVHDVAVTGDRVSVSVCIDRSTVGQGTEERRRVGGIGAEDGFRDGGADAVLAGGSGDCGGVVEDEGAVILERRGMH
jgi:hypothetical protein